MSKSDLMCRTCLQLICGEPLYAEDYSIPGGKTVKEQLQLCFPDMDLDITKKFIICNVCIKRLLITYKYFENCMKIERSIADCIKKGFATENSNWDDFTKALNRVSPKKESTLTILDECDNLNVEETKSTQGSVSKETSPPPLAVFGSSKPPVESQPLEKDDIVNVPLFNGGSHRCFKCHKCSLSFKTRKNLNSHYVASHTHTYACDWCEYWSKSFDNFKMHLRRHLNPQVHKCNFCASTFATKALKDLHTRSHLTCHSCKQEFKLVQSLAKHMPLCMGVELCMESDVMLVDATMFKCDNCFRMFSSADELLAHLSGCTITAPGLPPLASMVDKLEWINYDEQRLLNM